MAKKKDEAEVKQTGWNQSWDAVKTAEDVARLADEACLFDDSAEYTDDLYKNHLNPDLSAAEIEDAMVWAKYSRGVGVISGAPGSGKGITGIAITKKMQHYFGKRPMLDFKPRRAFGPYLPFNDHSLVEQLKRMSSVAVGEGHEPEAAVDKAAHEWATSQGQVYFQNAVVLLDEFKRYHYKREPGKPINKLMGQVYDVFRHLDLLVLGMCIDINELDEFSCKPKLTFDIRCTWMTEYTIQKYGLSPYSTMATIYPIKFVSERGVFDVTGRPETFIIEGGKPREFLGGKRYIDLYNTKDAKAITPSPGLLRGLKA